MPGSLKDSTVGADFLRKYLNQLPIPIVRLPPSCIVAPWWLVYVGHEVGHHIQYDLDLVSWLGGAVEKAVNDNGGTAGDAERWGRWSTEIFADIFSVLVMGEWALIAMVELELSNSAAMLTRRSSYPSPVIRLKLLADTADRLHLEGSTQLQARLQTYGLDLTTQVAANAATSADAAFISPILDIALGPLPGLEYDLARLVTFRPEEFLEDGPVEKWSEAFLTRKDRPIDNDLRSARLVTSATLRAWSQIMTLTDQEDRAALRTALMERAVEVIVASREPGMRAKGPSGKVADLGTTLADLLRQADRAELETKED